jgi:hypothetical protein
VHPHPGLGVRGVGFEPVPKQTSEGVMTESQYERALEYWLCLSEDRQNDLLKFGYIMVPLEPSPYCRWAPNEKPSVMPIKDHEQVMVTDVLAWSARRQGTLMAYTKRLKDRNTIYRNTLSRLSAFVHGAIPWLKYALMKNAIGCDTARSLLIEAGALKTSFADIEKEPKL